jgi:AcrR family transcriptional regulator
MNDVHSCYETVFTLDHLCKSVAMAEPRQAKKRSINPDAKRSAILAAATRLFAENGYEATSIAAIAAASDVAVGSVHRIFIDKSRLLNAAKQDLEERLTDVMVRSWNQPGTLNARFQAMLNGLFDEMIIVQPMMPIMALHAETAAPAKDGRIVKTAILNFVTEAIKNGVFRAMPPVEAAAIAFAMVDGAMRQAALGDLNKERQIYVPLLADMMTRALGSEPA